MIWTCLCQLPRIPAKRRICSVNIYCCKCWFSVVSILHLVPLVAISEMLHRLHSGLVLRQGSSLPWAHRQLLKRGVIRWAWEISSCQKKNEIWIGLSAKYGKLLSMVNVLMCIEYIDISNCVYNIHIIYTWHTLSTYIHMHTYQCRLLDLSIAIRLCFPGAVIMSSSSLS